MHFRPDLVETLSGKIDQNWPNYIARYMRVTYMRLFSRELMSFHTHNALSSVVTLTTCSWTESQEAEEMTHTLP